MDYPAILLYAFNYMQEGECAMSEQYINLTSDKTLVRGAKYGLVVDFTTGELHRLNKTACEILEYSQKALSLEETVARLKLKAESADAFIKSMLTKRIIDINPVPNSSFKICNSPPPAKLDFVWIEVISNCNLRCLHCYAEALPQQMERPGKKVVIDWMDQASKLGCPTIQLTGGECTLRDDLPELLVHARSRFDTVEIFTNATLLTPQQIRFLSENRIQVAFSFYSYKSDVHDRITGVPGSHHKTLESLKLLIADRVKVRGGIIGLKQNESDLEATEYFLKSLGVAVGPADPVRPCGRGRKQEFWPEKYGQCMVNAKPQFMPEAEQYCSSQYWNSCWFGKLAISPEGDVLPCVFARDQVAGNLYEKSLEQIFQNGLMSYWQLTRDDIVVCRDCEYRYLCRDCRPWAYGYTGDLNAKSPTCTYNPYTGEWAPPDSVLKF